MDWRGSWGGKNGESFYEFYPLALNLIAGRGGIDELHEHLLGPIDKIAGRVPTRRI